VRKLTLSVPPSFRIFESSQKESTWVKGTTVGGSKTFEYVLIPDREGKFSLGSVSLAMFNPGTRKFTTVRSRPLTLTVRPGTPPSNLSAGHGLSGQMPARLLREDIRYIKGDRSSLDVAAPPLAQSPWFFGLHVAALVLLGGAKVYRRRVERFQTDEVWQRTVRGSQAAKRWLREAEHRCQSGSTEEFYAALSRALLEYLAIRLNVPPAALSADSVGQYLAAHPVPEATIGHLVECLRRAEFARFAPTAGSEDDRAEQLERARQVIAELEKVFRNAK